MLGQGPLPGAVDLGLVDFGVVGVGGDVGVGVLWGVAWAAVLLTDDVEAAPAMAVTAPPVPRAPAIIVAPRSLETCMGCTSWDGLDGVSESILGQDANVSRRRL